MSAGERNAEFTEQMLLCLKSFQDYGFIITETEAKLTLIEQWGGPLEDGYLNLFMEASGYSRMPKSIPGYRGTIMPCWWDPRLRKKGDVDKLIASLDYLLDEIDPIRLFEVTVAVKQAYKGAISNGDVDAVLRIAEDIEVTQGFVSVRFDSLRGTTDKAYRILSIARAPMHYSAICREINMRREREGKKGSLKVENLTNQMASDERFTAIGKSGQWGLSSWEHLTNMTIVEAMERTLHRAGRPLTFQEIRDGMLDLRPDASERSLITRMSSLGRLIYTGKS